MSMGGDAANVTGAGQLVVDMQFLADVYVTCDQCRGTRFRDEVLSVRYRGKNIHEVLKLTVREAFSFFSWPTQSPNEARKAPN